MSSTISFSLAESSLAKQVSAHRLMSTAACALSPPSALFAARRPSLGSGVGGGFSSLPAASIVVEYEEFRG
jgi:hypothetical protein